MKQHKDIDGVCDLALNTERIQAVKDYVVDKIKDFMKSDLVEIILYGSCARGDYTEDSDIDIALITKCDRLEAKKYSSKLAGLATELAMEYFVIVNFICLPYEEYSTQNDRCGYFYSIREDGACCILAKREEVGKTMTIEMIKKAILVIVPKYPIKRVTLFGSRASGTNHDSSDIDLIMEFSASVSLLTLSEIQFRLEDMLGLKVDVIHGPMQETDLLEINEEIELYAA